MSHEDHPRSARVPTVDGGIDTHDHAIALVDTTDARYNPEQTEIEPSTAQRKGIIRNATGSSMKDRLARRKYAKWREDRYVTKGGSVVNEEEDVDGAPGAEPEHGPAEETGEQTESTAQIKKPKGRKQKPYEVDILYENQRGSFFCGIPLYSHSSLLNFDPGPWVTKEFKDSAVNITNAQVPDPSWEWAWKSWYVDMSYDVDEEGWQYSFMFGGKFAWHGTHPWFHSFVRRRRWLRKRVKKDHAAGSGKTGTMTAGHKFTSDYFTIHPKRDRSPGTVGEESRLSKMTEQLDNEQLLEEINDVATLLKALRFATVDREKVEFFKKFIDQGGDELALLGEYVPEIMSLLVFQNSKRQILSYLKNAANNAQKHRDEHDAEQNPEDEAEHHRIDNLLAAVDAADKQISGLEYWSDRKHVLRTADHQACEIQAIATIFDAPAPRPNPDDNPVDEIKGISDRAEAETDPNEPVYEPEPEPKGKEKEQDDGSEKAASPVRLGHDQVLIPDEDA